MLSGQPGDYCTPLHSVIGGESIACVELLIKIGADVHYGRGENPNSLHIAAYVGNTKIIKCLLQAGTNSSATSNKRLPHDKVAGCDGSWPRKPVEVASKFGNAKAVKILSPFTTPTVYDEPPPVGITIGECIPELNDIFKENPEGAVFGSKILEKNPDKRIIFMGWKEKAAKIFWLRDMMPNKSAAIHIK